MRGSTHPVRPPAVAGMFYPGDASVLAATVDGLLRDAWSLRSDRNQQHQPAVHWPKALIVPHAGYVYSGPIAASAYAEWQRAGDRIERVVLVGPAHRVYVPQGLAASGASAFRTPLGVVAVDESGLDSVPEAFESARAHDSEHSLEVQVPFIQRVLPHARIVPLLVSDAEPEVVGAAIEALWGGPETVIAISSDLSHYLPWEQARQIDEETAERILSLDPNIEPEQACGAAAVNGLLWAARRQGLHARLLDLRNSGDTAGGRDGVVGYGAFAFDTPRDPEAEE